eukprot:gene8192-8126_t
MEGNEWGDHLTLLAAGARHTATLRVWNSLESRDSPREFAPLDAAVRADKELTLGHYHEFHWVS